MLAGGVKDKPDIHAMASADDALRLGAGLQLSRLRKAGSRRSDRSDHLRTARGPACW